MHIHEWLAPTSLGFSRQPSCSMERRAKRQRQNDGALARLLARPDVSIESLRTILKELDTTKVPTCRKLVLREYKERLQHVLHTERLKNEHGKTELWSFCEPGKLLQYGADAAIRMQVKGASPSDPPRPLGTLNRK